MPEAGSTPKNDRFGLLSFGFLRRSSLYGYPNIDGQTYRRASLATHCKSQGFARFAHREVCPSRGHHSQLRSLGGRFSVRAVVICFDSRTKHRRWEDPGPRGCSIEQYRVQHASECCSAGLSHSFKVADRRRNAPKSAQNCSESLCAGLWVITVPDILILVWPSFRPQIRFKIEDSRPDP